jgi:hypothetical protein
LLLDQRSYYIDGPTYQNHWSLQRIAREPRDVQLAWLRENEIAYIMIPDDYVASSGALSGEIGRMLADWAATPASFRAMGPPVTSQRRDGRGREEVRFYAVQ